MYNRDGTPRGAWYDPLGFGGLDKVPPPSQAAAMLTADLKKLAERQDELQKVTPDKAAQLQALGIKLNSMECHPHLARQHGALEKEINSLSAEVRGLRREYSDNATLFHSLSQTLAQLKTGIKEDPRQHIRHMAIPDDPAQVLRFDRATETWAATSLSLLLFAIAALIFFAPKFVWIWLVVILILFLVIEFDPARPFH